MPEATPSDAPREFAVEVVRKLRAAGFQSLWAGGCVRDQLLGREPKDYDVATSARPEQVREVFGHRKTLAIGASFGVITVLGPKPVGQLDVATFRRDAAYSDGRHPDSVTFSDPEEDARRRDFTINGLFFDPLAEQVIDYVGGQADLKAGVIRAIGAAQDRIAEDKLRMLRAVRFAATFGFEIELATMTAIQQQASELVIVSAERIAAELRRMLTLGRRRLAIELLDRAGLLEVIFPEMRGILASDWEQTLAIVEALPSPTFPQSLAALLRPLASSPPDLAILADTACRRLKLSAEESGQVLRLLRDEPQLRRASQLTWPALQRLIVADHAEPSLRFATAVARVVDGQTCEIDACRRMLELPSALLNPPPLISGNDLKEIGLAPGPKFRAILDQVRDAQLNSLINTRNEAVSLAEKLATCVAVLLMLVFTGRWCAAEDTTFPAVASIFEKRCVQCHSTDEAKGGLSLSNRERILSGGDSGPAISPGKPNDSPLLDMVRGETPEMPKSAPKLTAEEVAAITKWVEAGAPWKAGRVLEDRSLADTNWWSLRPLTRPAVPNFDAPDKSWIGNPIDAFVLAKLREHRFSPAPAADRRTHLRRLYFDLIGLPPTPEEVDAWLNDKDPQAYEKLVDRLLDSPRHGERWARHWLDVVHFGETHGYDKDKPRPHAWPYRDYVIRAFNQDKPYGRFVEEQIAGDVLYPDTTDGIEALGFIAAGPWDFIGHAEVPESKTDGKIARHLDRDDMVSTTIGAFNSLTVGCAQCHNHKFDPIKQVDYYRLQAVFAALDRADRKYHTDPQQLAKYSTLEARQRELTAEKNKLTAEQQKLGGDELQRLDKLIQVAGQKPPPENPPEHGYHSQIEREPATEKWVQLDLGKPQAIAEVVLVGCFDDFNSIGAGFGFPVRFAVEASNDPAWKTGVSTLIDQTAADFPNPGVTPLRKKVDKVAARYLRIRATKLAPRQNDFILALAELQVIDGEGKNLASGASVTALDSIEAPIRWRKTNLVDGVFPPKPDAMPGSASLAELKQQRLDWLTKSTPASLQDQLSKNQSALESTSRELAQLTPPSLVYAGTVHHGSGTFIGTGSSDGKPRPIHLLHRGDVKQPREEVAAGALTCLPEWSGELPLAAEHREGDRRAALARWLSDRRNPLTWRSIVNRVWQYHFGRGLVDTPNDFGRMGELPTHPELLDWLAVEFRDGKQSIKSLHRLIVTSNTYRQQSLLSDPRDPPGNSPHDPRASDANNRFLWRMNRRKLEAEAVRDAVLQVAGKLDLKTGGPSFQDFVIDQPAHSPHYEYHLHDPNDVRSHRRSVYRFIVRSQPQPWMATLDCADPSMRVDKRNESLSALQALALLNNGFMVTMSGHFAERVASTTKEPAEQARMIYRLALAREPTMAEQTLLSEFIRAQGLANACRAVINLNEFTFID